MKPTRLISIALLFAAPSIVSADELSQGTIISNKDKSGSLSLCVARNITNDFDPRPESPIIVCQIAGSVPFAAYSSDQDGGVRLGAWTSSSRYAFIVTGNHNAPELSVFYPKNNKTKHLKVDLKPLWAYGRKYLPDHSGPMSHDNILNLMEGPDDSVICIYQRTTSPQNFFVPVQIKMSNASKGGPVSFKFGKRITKDLQYSDPPLAEILKGLE